MTYSPEWYARQFSASIVILSEDLRYAQIIRERPGLWWNLQDSNLRPLPLSVKRRIPPRPRFRMPPSIPGCQLRGLWSAAWAYNYPLSQTRSGLTYDLRLFNLPWPESNRRHTHISGRLYHLSYKGILPGYSRLRARAVRRPMERDRFVILPAIAYYHSSFAPKCNFLKNI